MRTRPRWATWDALTRLVAPRLPTETERGAGGRLLRECLGQYRLWGVLLALSTVGRSVGALLLPPAVGAAIDAAPAGGAGMTVPLIQVAVVLAVVAGGDAITDLAGAYYGAGVTAGVRDRLVRQTLRLGISARRRFPPGDLLSRLSVDAASPGAFLPLLLGGVVAVLTLLGSAIALGVLDWTLALTFLIGLPAAVLTLRLFVARVGEPTLRYQQLQAGIVTRLLDALNGARTIRASGTREREVRRILEPLPRLHSAGREVWDARRRVSWQVLLVMGLLQVFVLCVAGVGLSAGRITTGDLVAASAYVVLAMNSFELVDSIAGAIQSHVGASRVATVLTTPPAVTEPAAPEALPPGPGRIEMRGVTVRRGDRTVLDGLDLTVPPATSVAVVGRSGTGKSVLVSLLGRLLAPGEGEVRIDGVDVAALDHGELRRAVTYAFERPALLGATVCDTIAYARPEASRAQVEEAARAAQADHFVRLLPHGYDTAVARAPLSGGEAQRLGLARALLTEARVVVLDDAMNSLDTATEVKVAEALTRTLSGRTSVIVAHRAATAGRADLVAWLDGGRVRALASHAELWSDPEYRRIFAAAEEPASDSLDPVAGP